MKKPLIALTLTACLPGLNAYADNNLTQDSANPNWFSLGPQFGLQLNARFKYSENGNSSSPGAASGGVNHTYDDGFVRVDSSGDAGGQTWNWGYQSSSQVQNNTVVMHSASGVNGSTEASFDEQPGFDLAFGRDLGTVAGGKWGLQGAFDFTAVSIQSSRPINGTGTLISDAYQLNGVPPPAPYAGSYNGPGELLGDTPSRTVALESVQVTGSRTLNAQVFALRTGPYYEIALGNGWSGRVGGGLALTVADTQYQFDETINYGGGSMVNKTGSADGADFQAGAYLEAKVLYAMTEHTSLFAGAQYEYLGSFSRGAGSDQAQLDLSNVIEVLFGLEVRF